MRSRHASRLLLVIGSLIFACALYLIQVRYAARELQAQFDEVAAEVRSLEEQARRFQIELASLTDYSRLHETSVGVLGMVFPDPAAGTLILLEEAGGD